MIFIFISFREKTIARKWGWDDGVTNWTGRSRGNQLRFREEDDDCHGPAALQAIVFALAADASEQFRKQPEPVLGHAAGQASRAAVCQKPSSTYRSYRWESVRTHCESHLESVRQGIAIDVCIYLKEKERKKSLHVFRNPARCETNFRHVLVNSIPSESANLYRQKRGSEILLKYSILSYYTIAN